MSPHAATGPDALAALLFLLCWPGGTSRLSVWDREGGEHLGGWWRSRDMPALQHLVAELDVAGDHELTLSSPRPNAGWGTCDVVGCLWVVADSPKRVERLSWIRQAPALVLVEGKRRLAVWGLERPIPYEWALKANRRLAYRVGAVQKHGDPDSMEFWVPGSCRRRGRVRPSPVVVESCAPVFWPARALVGALKDPPPMADWRKAVG